jgi:hypothetical protein
MTNPWHIVVAEFAERAGGTLSPRLILQPLIASIFAIRAGLWDAAAGRKPYLWGLLTSPENRGARIRDGWKTIGKVFLLAIGLDVTYQLIVHGDVILRQAIILAVLIAIIPYVVLRGATTWIAHAVRSRTR